jgi:predicted nuclease of restriction endonuclease-like (RecB) superfamily
MVDFEQKGKDRAKYGDQLFDELSSRLKIMKGIDRRALYRFKDFYLLYPQIAFYIGTNHLLFSQQIVGSMTPQLEAFQKVGSLTPQSQNKMQVPAEKLLNYLSYTHIEQLLQIKDLIKRTFYEIECIRGTWSVRELKRQINSLYYERSGMSKKPEMLREITQQKAELINASDIVKSLYAFEFLGLKAKDAVEESDLETALLDHLQDFMMEMGDGFCLEARQKKILIGNEYFFIDLVFYHRILKCHVLVELKVEEFNDHNIGQLNTYVNYYKATVMRSDDNPTVGILLVTNKNTALVEFATTSIDNKLFVSKYLLELPKKEVLEAFITNELQKWNS